MTDLFIIVLLLLIFGFYDLLYVGLIAALIVFVMNRLM